MSATISDTTIANFSVFYFYFDWYYFISEKEKISKQQMQGHLWQKEAACQGHLTFFNHE
jgi:hypothetical protein